MATMKQYQAIVPVRDINPVIKKGMIGVILEVLDADTYIVEFVQDDGRNFEYDGQGTFDLKGADLQPYP
jgi:hypothetical protein